MSLYDYFVKMSCCKTVTGRFGMAMQPIIRQPLTVKMEKMNSR